MSSSSNGVAEPIRIVVKRVGSSPVVQEMSPTLESMQRLVSGRIELLQFDLGDLDGHGASRIGIWVNEEGVLEALPMNIQLPSGQVVVGDVFFSQCDPPEPVSLTDTEIERLLSAFASGAFRVSEGTRYPTPDLRIVCLPDPGETKSQFLAKQLQAKWNEGADSGLADRRKLLLRALNSGKLEAHLMNGLPNREQALVVAHPKSPLLPGALSKLLRQSLTTKLGPKAMGKHRRTISVVSRTALSAAFSKVEPPASAFLDAHQAHGVIVGLARSGSIIELIAQVRLP